MPFGMTSVTQLNYIGRNLETEAAIVQVMLLKTYADTHRRVAEFTATAVGIDALIDETFHCTV